MHCMLYRVMYRMAVRPIDRLLRVGGHVPEIAMNPATVFFPPLSHIYSTVLQRYQYSSIASLHCPTGTPETAANSELRFTIAMQ